MISEKQKKLKGSMLVVLLLLMPSMLYAACTGSSPTWTTTPDYTSVNSCVQKALIGDTINVTAGDGSETWNTKLAITKGIRLVGPGRDKLTITSTVSSSDYAVSYIPGSPSLDGKDPFEISGFTWVTNHWLYMHVGTAEPQSQIEIHDNKVTNAANRMIMSEGPLYGVIYNNVFNNSVEISLAGNNENLCQSWDHAIGGSKTTLTQHTFGNANYMYVEDNTFNTITVPADGGHGGRWVYRYNTIVYSDASALSPWFDMHQNQPLNGVPEGSIAGEAYGNKISSINGNISWMYDHRGGRARFFYNKIENKAANPLIRVRNEEPEGTGACATYKQKVTDSYYWANYYSSTLTTLYHATDGDGAISVENTDYFIQKTGSFDGKGTGGGIGCGTLAQMNAIKPTIIGVGFWATDQSCTSINDKVGANPTTPISGTLYKWNGTAWVSSYTPYTYPHPLRSSTENAQGLPPTIAVSPSTKDFGTLPINTSSPVQKFTVTTSGGNLNVDAISMTGTDANQFSIQNDSCTGKIIAPSTGSCTFEAKFSPSSVGAKAANVAIVDNDSNTTKLVAVNGTGTGQVPAMSFSPTSLSFTGVLVGTLPSKTVTLSNTGASFVSISSIILSGTNANQFSIPAATDHCTGDTVAASGNCTFQIVFSPTSGGEKTANVNLTSLYYSSPATLPLSGSAVVPRIKISRNK